MESRGSSGAVRSWSIALLVWGPLAGCDAVPTSQSGAVLAAPRAPLADPTPTPLNFALHAGPFDDAAVWINPNVVAIYWSARPIFARQPAPGSYGPAAGDRSVIGRFLATVGSSAHWKTVADYINLRGNRIGPIRYVGYWADADENRFDRTSLAGVEYEIQYGIDQGLIPYHGDSSMIYAVFAGPGVNLGGIRTKVDGGEAPCGEHHFAVASGRRWAYAVLPLNWRAGNYWPDAASCDYFPGPFSINGDARADGMIHTLDHELAEAATNPGANVRPNGWFDDNGIEMADFCSKVHGRTKIGSRSYYTDAFLRLPELDCAL
jgi:hypothetical protein